MSPSGADRPRLARLIPVLSILSLLALPASAQEPPLEPADEYFPLGPTVRTRLAQLQTEWLDWLIACNEGDGERAAAAIELLLSHTRLVGMEHLPELSTAAAKRAIEFAEAGDAERAAWGIEAADRLDPSRPEVAFGAARVARLSGDYGEAAKRYFGGMIRALRDPQARFFLLNNLAVWLAAVATLTGLLLVGVLMVARGPELYFDLFQYFHRYAPAAAAHLLCLILLSWPLLLPAGVLWTAIYWSVLLWVYGGGLQRALLIAIWLFVSTLPLALTEQGRRISLELYPPVHSIQSAAFGRLEGDLFNHLRLLHSSLPESAALEHLSADIHRKLGQMENARSLYQEVLDREASNATALNDLAIYYFEVSDFDRAAELFSRAAESDPEAAETHFNLGQTYSELYRFEESERALLTARALDSEAVNQWLKRGEVERVVPMNGGLGRVTEIRSELRSQWDVGEATPGWFGHWRRALSLPLIAVFVLIAVVLRMTTRRGRLAKVTDQWWRPALDGVRRVLLVGVPEAEARKTGRAALALLLLVGLASLPLANRLGYGLPWLHSGGSGPLPILAVAGLVLFFGVRYLKLGRGER